jgi:hypothetical protein
LHGFGRDDRQDETERLVTLGASGAEDIDGFVALVFDACRALTTLEPSSCVSAGLADPSFILEPDFDALGSPVLFGDLGG